MSRERDIAGVPESGPPPRANSDLVGHSAAERMLRRLFERGRLPHALLLTGPRGIGKATLAFRLARFVLARSGADAGTGLFADDATGEGLSVPSESGAFRRVASGGHADLLTVERAHDSKGRLRTIITVDDTREIEHFLHLTSAEGGWRVAIVDGADRMHPSAENALLKILEEPPSRSVLILVANTVGRLLPTTRSRCRKLALSPLDPATVRQLLLRYRPDLNDRQAHGIAALADGSIGRALDLAGAGGIDLHRSLLSLLERQQGIDALALHAFADRVARRDADQSYRAVEELLGQLLARLAMTAAGRTPEKSRTDDDAAVLRRLGGRAPAARWAELREEIGQSFLRTDRLNLDRKQTILGAFFAIERAAG